MVAPLTENRQRKLAMIKEAIDSLLMMSWMDTIDRDNIKMSDFKALISKVNDMKKAGEYRKLAKENNTKKYENMPAMPIDGQTHAEGSDLH